MRRLSRLILVILITSVFFGCTPGGSASLARKDLSKVVLQQSDVPAAFSNLSVLGDEAGKMFFPLEDDDRIENFYGVSYLYPKDGLNYIYSVVLVLDDEESSKSVYQNVTQQVNSQLHRLKDEIGDESLLFSTLSGTSYSSIWRYKEAVCYVAVMTKLQLKFDYEEMVATSKLVQSRLEE